MKKFFCLVALLFLTSCGSSPREDVLVEDFLPSDSEIVLKFDYLDDDKRALLKDVLSRFPETGLAQHFWGGFSEAFDAESGFDEQQMLLVNQVVQGEWGLALGVKSQEEDWDGLLVFETSEPDALEDLIYYTLDKEEALFAYDERGAFRFWWSLDDDSEPSIGRYADYFFVFEGGQDDQKELMDRVEDSSGFEQVADEGLGYFYFNREGAELLVNIDVDDEGFRFSSSEIWPPEEFELIESKSERELSLFERVNGEGIAYYLEDLSFAPYLKLLFRTFAFDAAEQESFFTQLSTLSGLERQEIDEILAAAFAFSVDDFGGYYPGFSLYLDLSEENLAANAKKLNIAFDRYVQQVIALYDEQIAALGEGAGALKTDVIPLEGGAFHKLYLDWNVFSREAVEGLAFVPGFDPKDVKVALYYGLTGDGIYVLALHPEFENYYGRDVLSDNELFLEALVGFDDDANRLVYGRFDPLLSVAERWYLMIRNLGVIAEEDKEIYETFSKEWLPTIRYYISLSALEDGRFQSAGRMKIEKL